MTHLAGQLRHFKSFSFLFFFFFWHSYCTLAFVGHYGYPRTTLYNLNSVSIQILPYSYIYTLFELYLDEMKVP